MAMAAGMEPFLDNPKGVCYNGNKEMSCHQLHVHGHLRTR